MRIKITTDNRLGLSKEILALLAENDIDVKKVEVEIGLMFVETEPVEKHLAATIASRLMKIPNVKWVENISLMPTRERNLFLTSLLNAITDPVVGVNNKGHIIYYNDMAGENFKISENKLTELKDIFQQEDWASIVDTAASGNMPVNIKTVSGSMLVEVQAITQKSQKTVGAVLVFHKPESITTRSHLIEGAEISGFDKLISNDEKMLDVINRASHMGNIDTPLIIYGESGVGKKTIAQAIHHSGKRKNMLFSTIDCSVSNPQQLEVELFGLANPVSGKAGLLEISDGGTVFIRSIADMPENCQKKLSDFINNKYFYRVNGKIKKEPNIKIIASNTESLQKFVENNRFDKELFYSLDITRLSVPPLRERKEDIEPIANYFLSQFSNQSGKEINGMSFEALNKIKTYFWPGNITQLKDTLFKASMLTDTETITSESIEIDGHAHIESSLENKTLSQAVSEFERHFLEHWYQKYPSTRKLANQLGVSHTTIAQKLNKYKIN